MTNQYKVLSAVMSQMEIAQRAYGEALDSSGMTMKQNEVYMNSLEAKVQALKAEFEKLVIGDGGLQDLAKTLVEIATAILEFANSGVGQTIIKTALLTTTIVMLGKAMKTLVIDKIVSAIISLGEAMLLSAEAGTGLLGVLTALEINPIVLAITALVGIVVVATKAYDSWNHAIDRHKEKLAEATSEYNEALGNMKELKDKLKDVEDKIKEINDLGGAKTSREGELAELQRQKVELEALYEIEKNRYNLALQQKNEEARKTLDSKVWNPFAQSDTESALGQAGVRTIKRTDIVQAIKDASDAMKEQTIIIDELSAKKEREGSLTQDEIDKLESAVATYNSANEKANEYSETLQQVAESTSEGTTSYERAMDGLNYYAEAIKETSKVEEESTDSEIEKEKTLEELIKEYELTQEEVKKLNELLENAGEDVSMEDLIIQIVQARGEIEELKNATQDYVNSISQIGNMSKEFQTLTDAMNEYNSTGQFSLDTLSSLLSLGDDYLSLLQFENGQMSINEQGLEALANARIDEAEAKAYAKAMAELQNGAEQDLTASINDGAKASEASYGANATAVNGVNNAIDACYKGVVAWNAYWSAESKGAIEGGNVTKERAKQIGDSLRNEITALENARKGLGKYTSEVAKGTYATKQNTGAHKGNTSARKENTDAIKEQTEALEKQKKALEDEKKALEDNSQQYADAFEFIEDTMKRHIEDLKDKRDKNLQHLEDRAQKIVGTYQKSNNEVTKVIEDYKKTHEKALDDINDLFKEAEKNYRKDMENILDDWEDFTSRIGNFDEYEKNGAKAFEQTELQQKESRLKEVQRSIDILNEKKAHLGGKEREDIQAQIDAYEEEEAELYKVIGAKKAEQEYNKIVEDTNKRINDLQIKSLQKQKQEISDYYAEKIKQEEKSNETLEEQLKLQEALEKMARAKSNKVMVYKNGSWQYQSSEKDVSSAQETYAEIKRQQEKTAITNQLKEEEAKKIAEIEAKIEELTKKTEKSYEEQIEDAKQYLIDIKAEYDKQEKAYSDKITKRNESYQVELDNLTKKVTAENEQYEKTIAKLTTLETKYTNIKKKYEELLPPMENFLKKVQAIRQEMEGDGKKKKAFEDIFKMDSDKLVANWKEISTQLGTKKTEWNKIIEQIQPLEFKIKDLDKTLSNLKNLTTSANNAAGAYERLARAKTSAGFGNDNGNNNGDDKTNGSQTYTWYKPYDNDKRVYDTLDKAKQERSKLMLDPKQYPIIQIKNGKNVQYLITNGATSSKSSTNEFIKSEEYKKGLTHQSNYTNGTITYASGTASVRGNQVAVTGEDPNREIVLGSKANGVLTHIDNGGGVINANGTRTLAGLFNALGQFSSSNFGGSVGTLSSVNKSNSTNISIGNISLPNVQNGKDFVDYLQNFSMSMIQASF